MKPTVIASAAKHRLWIILAIGLMIATSIAGCGSQAGSLAVATSPSESTASTTANPSAPASAATSATRTVTDLAGRKVTIPVQVNRIATVGPVPYLNSYVLALGEGSKIVSGLSFAHDARFKFETIFAPNLANNPDVQGANNAPNLEDLLKLKPDIALVQDPTMADTLQQKAGIPTIVLSPDSPDKIKQGMLLMGEVLNQQALAQDYAKYFGDTIQRVQQVVGSILENSKPSVLYVNIATLQRRGPIMEYTIPEAGGRSVTAGTQAVGRYQFTNEQMLQWNPDVMFGMEPDDLTKLTTNPLYKDLSAVKNHRIYIVPTGAHTWGNGSTEQPLLLLWTAKLLYPDQFKDLDIAAETKSFYQRFFKTTLSDEQVQELLTSKR